MNRFKSCIRRSIIKRFLNKVEEHISKQIKAGYFFVDLKTSFMHPFRDKIMEELVRNGYRIELCPSHIMSEHLMITWK